MAKHKKKLSQGESVGLALLGLVGVIVLVTILLQDTNVALFNPKGLIAGEQHRLMLFIGVMLLGIAIPTLFVFYFFAWKYRESNKKATHNPDVRYGKLSVLSLWAIPSFFMLALAFVMWPATHELDPHKAIATNIKPITIQVIAMRWKWLFIYPEQNIATVNFVQVPTDVPVQFELTADEAPMSSFWVPNLGGQLYAMTGHANVLNLVADTPGDYPGRTAEINGPGFAGMKFVTRASDKEDFDSWVQDVKLSSNTLNFAEYKKLLVPSENNSKAYYASAQTYLYDSVLNKYAASHGSHVEHE